ncbi:MAG: ABC transporter ATP-binding protein, partial [Clostridia bacterium]|nr:ABC transporter ATP-binding protein [Clostridia bacterium]
MKQQRGGSAGTKSQNQIAASAKKYRKWFVIGPVFKLTEAVFELLIPTLMVYVIDRGVSGRDGAYVLRMIPLMLGIAVLGYLSALVCQYVASLSSQGFGTELRERLFRHLLAIPQKEADRLGTPTMVNRVTTDVNILQQAVAMLIRLAIRAPFICIGSLVMAAILNLKLTMVILCALPFLIAAVILVMRVSVPLFTKVQQKLDNSAVIARENMSGARVIRAFSRKNNEKARFDAECDGYNKAVEMVNRVSTLLNPLTTLIMNLAVLAVLW